MSTELRELYPEIEPYSTGRLKVSDVHELNYEECGNPDGHPVIVIHGGPGGGIVPSYRQYFDPEIYRVVLLDQRGAGKSTPAACLENNTTWDLVKDFETLREHLGISKWLVFGGSWGSTLSLSYAQTHPDRVVGLVLRGIFMLRKKELEWFYEGKGANFVFPDRWEKFLDVIPEEERGSLMKAYHSRLTGDDEEEKLKAARAWSCWEMATSRLYVDPKYIARAEEDDTFCLQFARIESHYFVNGGFFEVEDQLLRDVDKIKHIPCVIVQGRYDMVCPTISAWELYKAYGDENCTLHIIADAGHSVKEPGITSELVKATDAFSSLFASS